MIKKLLALMKTPFNFNRKALASIATIVITFLLTSTVYLMIQTSIPPVSIVVRRVDVNGQIQTSVRQMNAENVTINGNASITGGLYIVGSPQVRLNGKPTYGGLVEGTGNPQPNSHQVTLNGNAILGKLFNRIDPAPLPTVDAPPNTSGIRDVSINSASDQVGDFATVRDLTINGNVPPITVPAGTYRNFTANNSGFILGATGATQPIIYNFNKLTLNGNAQLQVLSSVVVTVKEDLNVNSSIGNATNSSLLTLRVSNGSVTLNGNASFSGTVIAPSGTVTVNGNTTITGIVIADKLVVNGNGVVRSPSTNANPPTLTIQQPTNNTITKNATITVAGTVTSNFAPTVKVNGVAVTLNGSTFTTTVNLTEGSNAINVVATDIFNSQATATVTVIKDTTSPVLTITQPTEGAFLNTQQVLVKGTVTDAMPTQVIVNDVVATITNGQYMATVPISNEGANTITVKATDSATNQTTLTRNIIRDTIAPIVTVTQPQEGATITTPEVTVTGSFSDANPVTVMVNNIAASITGNTFTVTVALTNGANVLTVKALDIAGNQTQTSRNVTRMSADTTPPELIVFTPVEGSFLKSINVRGRVIDESSVVVTVNGNQINTDVNGLFLFESFSLSEGIQEITVVAIDQAGNRSEVIRNITVDFTPPIINLISPSQQTLINGTQATVQIEVSDMYPLEVFIDGVKANLVNGVFTATVPIKEDENTIIMTAKDPAGNIATSLLQLIGKDFTPPRSPTIFSVTSPTRLAYQTIEGRAEVGSRISILGGNIPINTTAAEENGLFVANVNLKAGVNNLSITAIDKTGNVSNASQVSIVSNPTLALPPSGQAYQLNISTGDAQRGIVGMELPRPLIVSVTDKDGNFVSGIPIKFSVLQGGKFVNNSDIFSTNTDASGHATARYVCSNDPGIQLIQADFTGNTLSPIKFVAENISSIMGDITSFSGTVLDQNMRALPNVLVRLNGQQTRTDSTGEFALTNVPAGPHQLLELVGRDQITLPGRWPNISYDVDILPGVDNRIRRPLFLPRVNEGVSLPLDTNNVVMQNTTVEQAVIGKTSIKVTAKAGTRVMFPPDVTDKRLSVTKIALDRIPMELEEGRYTSLYVSVQPSGAVFDPPLEVTFPNVDQLPANSIVLLMSFDHDAGRYVQVGTGHVSSDGNQITSDVGSGIRVGAWHAFPPSAPSPTTTLTGDSQGCMCMIWSNGIQATPVGLSEITVSSPSNDQNDNNPLVSTTVKIIKYRANVTSNSGSGGLQAQCKECPDLDVVRQRAVMSTAGDIKIASKGDFSCLMVSKFVTDKDLPALSTFAPSSGQDRDTFRILLTSPRADTTNRDYAVRIQVIGGTYDKTFPVNLKGGDPLTGQTLYKTDKYFRLVSNDVDDNYLGDQTIKVKLLDQIKFTLVVDGKVFSDRFTTFTVGRPPSEDGINAVRTVDVKFLTLNGINSAPTDSIELLNTLWAQAAVRFSLIGEPVTVTPVRNGYTLKGTATKDGRIATSFKTKNENGKEILVSVNIPITKDEIAESVASKLATEISKFGIPASFHKFPYLGVSQIFLLVNKQKDIGVQTIDFGDSGIDFNVALLDFKIIDSLHFSALGLNYGRDSKDDKTVYLIAVKELGLVRFNDALAASGNYSREEFDPGSVNVSCLSEGVIQKTPTVFQVIGHELCHILLNENEHLTLNPQDPDPNDLKSNMLFIPTRVDLSLKGPRRLNQSQHNFSRATGQNPAVRLLQKK